MQEYRYLCREEVSSIWKLYRCQYFSKGSERVRQSYVLSRIDNWRERKEEVRIGQKMPNVFTKRILHCQTSVNFQFNGVMKFAGKVKIRWFDTFARCKSREGEYRVSYGTTLKLSGRRRLYGVYIYYVKGYLVSYQEQMERENTKFSILEPITKLLNLHGTNHNGQANQSSGILNKTNQLRVLQRTRHGLWAIVDTGRLCAWLLI